jgi:hypothetical protein
MRGCYSITVSRLLTLLILFAFVFTNGPAVAMAMCQHEDARAHVAALQSAEAVEAIVAQTEEAAAERVSKQAIVSDAATTLLAGYILPPESPQFLIRFVERTGRDDTRFPRLETRSVPPLLEPPLVRA